MLLIVYTLSEGVHKVGALLSLLSFPPFWRGGRGRVLSFRRRGEGGSSTLWQGGRESPILLWQEGKPLSFCQAAGAPPLSARWESSPPIRWQEGGPPPCDKDGGGASSRVSVPVQTFHRTNIALILLPKHSWGRCMSPVAVCDLGHARAGTRGISTPCSRLCYTLPLRSKLSSSAELW